MSGETAVSNNSAEEVGKEVKAEVKLMEAEKVSPPKVSEESLKPEESSCPAASSAEPESMIDVGKKIEPPVKEEVKEIDGDAKLKAEDLSVVAAPLVETSEQKIVDKQVELPPSKEEKRIEDDSLVEAGDKDIPVVEKVSVSEPDVGCASEPITEKIESKSEEKLDTKIDEKLEQSKVEAIEEKQAEPQKVVALPAKSSVEAVEEVVENAVELPPNEVEAILAKEETVSEAACKQLGEIGEPKPDESVGNPVEPAKIVDDAGESSVEPFDRKIENVEEIPAKGVEIIEEKEVKVSEAECKPEENSETEPTKKLAGSKVELIEEKQDEPEKIEELPETSSVPAVEEKVKSVEELPIKNVEANEEKEVNDSETECKADKNSETGRAAKQEESTPKLIEEKLDEPTKIAHVPEQSSIEVVEKKVEELPAKNAEATLEKEKVSETESKPEETTETKHVEFFEENPVEPTNIIEVPEQSLAKAVEEKLEKVEEFPAKLLETIEEKLVKISEAECKHEEILETKPVELVQENSVESAKIDEGLEKTSIETVEEKLEKVEELPAKEVEVIQERALKVLEAECQPKEIPETEPVEKLEESKVELVEEKRDKPTQIVDVPVQSSVEAVEDNMGKGVELPVKEVEVILEKEMKVSDAECKPEEIPETELVAKLKESKVDLVEEKIDNPTQIVDVPEPSSVEVVEDNTGKGVELADKEVETILEKEMKVSDAVCKPEEIQGAEPIEKLKESKVELVEEKSVKPTEIVDVPEQSPAEAIEDNKGKEVEFSDKEVEPISQEEMKGSEAECKPEEISETEFSEKQEESKVNLVEEKLDEPKKATNLPEQISIKDVEDKVEKGVELPVKDVEATWEEEEKLSEVECKPEEISEIKPAESVEEKPVEPPKIVDVAEEKLEKVEELPAKVAEPSLEKEAKVLEVECKPEVISESVPFLEEEPVERNEVTEPTKKETLAAEPVENVKVEDEQSKFTEPTEKETLAAEPVENVMVEDTKSMKEEEPIKPKTQVEQTDVVCSTTDEMSEKTDATNDENEFVKKTLVIDALPELVESGKIEVETEAPEEKSVKAVESPQCEPKPIEDAASSIHLPDFTEKSLEKEIATKDIDLVAENGHTKHETVVASTETTQEEVEGTGDEEASKEAEKTESEKKTEDIAHSLKEKLEQEKHNDEAIKTDVQNSESAKECEDTKASKDIPKEDAGVKTTQKQSNNIIKMVKHSLVKAKKAIIGKSSNSKAPASEIKGDDACK